MIELKHLHTYTGPNVFATDPVIVVSLKLGAEDIAAAGGKSACVKRKLPAWSRQRSLENFPDAVSVGEYFATFAHWLLNEARGYVHVARCIKADSATLLILGYHEPGVSLLAIRLAVQIHTHAAESTAGQIESRLAALWAICKRHHPDYQARILMVAATSLGIPVLPFVKDSRYWQYGWGNRSRTFMESRSNADGAIAVSIARDKSRNKAVFDALGMPTPESILVNSVNELQPAVSRFGYPCVIKPLNSGGGKGVTANITNYGQLARAFETARKFSDGPLRMERFVEGEDHRLMVIDGNFVAGIRREPSHVIGDGSKSVRQLVEVLNSRRSVNIVNSAFLRPIAFDHILSDHLATQDMSLDEVPQNGRKVGLRSNANLSTGGTCIEITGQVHPLLKKMVEQLADSIGICTGGIDYITTDISASPWESGGKFIEINSTPGLELPVAAGWTAEKMGRLVLGEMIGRIPIDLYLESCVPKSIEAGLMKDKRGESTAIVFGKEIHAGEAVFKVQNSQPWAAVYGALRNKRVERVEIHCTIDEVITHGLPVDRVDRVIINGIDVPEEWRRVLNEHSSEVIMKQKAPADSSISVV